MAHGTRTRAQRKHPPAQIARRRRKIARRARKVEEGIRSGLVVFLHYVRTLGVMDWFEHHVVRRAPQAVFHKSGCFLALMVRAVVGIRGMGDLVSYLCRERLAKTLGFEKELTFVNPIADLLKEFSETMVNDLLQETVRLLVKCGVQLGEVVAVDGSFLHVYGKKYEKAERGYSGHLGKTALGYKLHLAYDAQLRVPIAMTITPGNVCDAKALATLRDRIVQAMGRRPNQMFLLDRGYFDATALHHLDRDEALFVCRAKMWPKYITSAVEELRDKEFLFRAKKYCLATILVIEPTTGLLPTPGFAPGSSSHASRPAGLPARAGPRCPVPTRIVCAGAS